MKMINRIAIAAAVAGAAAVAAAAPWMIAGAGSETLRVAHHHTVGGQLDRTAHVFADEVRRLTNGELEVIIFPVAQLGQQQEAYDQLDLGIIDMTLSPSALMDKKWAAIRHADLPFLWESFEHFVRARNGDWGQEMTDRVLANSNTRVLGWGGAGFRDMIFRGDPVLSVAGMSGMKMRAPESRLWIRMFELLDARPTPVSWGEVYTAMQTGVAAGLDSPAIAALDMKFDEVTESVVKTQHQFGIIAININESRFQSLSPEFQAAVVEAGKKAAEFFDADTLEKTQSAYAEMEQKGMTVVELADRSAWVARMSPLWDEIKADHPDMALMIDLAVAAR